eukprot:CAMPEP_0183702578 /NCGR_PEP_ID=MMETSP0737-20130205/633_1 /TAXON_ID=385413 /ORGANISM="Thalassiosira miniscula, Strain CCMP1093" /LENGTH=683 /DNA_ID=CAMNT_0025929211 /DNA_START=160 /DNA_END=2211 /DNA_ORIENTATION=-
MRSNDKIEITHVSERSLNNEAEDVCIAKIWWAFSRLCTLFIPDAYFSWVGVSDESKRQARREKWTICFVMFLFSAVFVGIGGLFPILFCEDKDNFTGDDEAFNLNIPKEDILCEALNFTMYCVMIIISAVLVIQCVCSLVYAVRLQRNITRDDTRSKLIVMVPCYNEGEKELKKTIDSVVNTTYPESNKVLLVVADGNITGKNESSSTPEILAEILGYNINEEVGTFQCTSIGEETENQAKLYSGIFDDNGTKLKYLVIVKCGLLAERCNPRAGNRGKRDSQLLLTGLLNRFHHDRQLNELDEAITQVLEDMDLPLEEIKYLMAIDADTRVDRDSITQMLYSMNKDKKILALCGETKIDNKSDSWITMTQVFEYYTNHHMKKAFESVFGCVTCLPGCFTMYRLFSDNNIPLLSCDDVYQRYAKNNVETLHEKNLFHLGEDRMLTTLLLRAFPGMKLSFVPEAICYTIVPDTFAVLLSQRRRWINSTFHNMLQLLKDSRMPTVCCVSMKLLVAMDLIATLILPASLVFAIITIYISVVMGEAMSTIMLIALGISIGVQVLVFLLRSRWDYWWWFVVFMAVGVPIFYFILPLYSFWNMDDFSWGATRLVAETTSPVDLSLNVDNAVDGQDEPNTNRDSRVSPVSSYDSTSPPSDLDEAKMDEELCCLDEQSRRDVFSTTRSNNNV